MAPVLLELPKIQTTTVCSRFALHLCQHKLTLLPVVAWSMDDLTTLCTDGCSKSLSTWLDAVEQKCEGEEVTINGLFVDPKAFPMKYISGYDLACLRDRYGSAVPYIAE